MFFLILTCICFADEALSNSLISPCKFSNISCLEKSVKNVLPQILAGIPELGVETSDPQFLEIIEGNLSNLKYTLFNSTILGYKNCNLSNFKSDEDISNIHMEIFCADLVMYGQYELNGTLLTLPIEGKGNFSFYDANFILIFDFKMEKVKGEDGKTHLNINSFKIKSKPLGLKILFRNLYNGQKKLADAAHEFAKVNWLQITETFQYPIWNVSFQEVSRNVNKFLENITIQDILLN